MSFTVRFHGYEIECPSANEAAELVGRLERERASARYGKPASSSMLSRALHFLQQHGPARAEQLARALGVHPKGLGNVTRQLAQLVSTRTGLTFDEVLLLERHGTEKTWSPGPRAAEALVLLATVAGGDAD